MVTPDPELLAKLASRYQKDLDEAQERAMKLRTALTAAAKAIPKP